MGTKKVCRGSLGGRHPGLGDAVAILSSGQDLLALGKPFGIASMTPAEFVKGRLMVLP